MRIIYICISIFFLLNLFFACTPPEEDPPENTPTPITDPVEISFAEYQGIETHCASDWEFFSIEDSHYLIVANFRNDSTRIVDSKLYKWNGYTFSLHQTIPTTGAMDWEYFSIYSNHFLAVANFQNDSINNVNSEIYMWDTTLNKFTWLQNIATHGAADWESFSFGNNFYLIAANYNNDTTFNINSELFRWDGGSFISHQLIPTHGAFDWEYFAIGESHYLAVANQRDDATYNINSGIYKWESGSGTFVLLQNIATNGAVDWEFFTIGDDYYLAVANSDNGVSVVTNSRIYKWDSVTGNFVYHQAIETKGAVSWEFFTIEENQYLGAAYLNDDETALIDSLLFLWNPGAGEFINDVSIGTMGARDITHFSIGTDHYLAIGNSYDDVTFNVLSPIYKMMY